MLRRRSFWMQTTAIIPGLSMPSLGALIPTATLLVDPSRGVNFLAPEGALGSPWVAYQFNLVATAGEVVEVVDVSFTGNVLHQRWRDNDFDGIADPSPTGSLDHHGDSHLDPPANSPLGLGLRRLTRATEVR